MSRRDFRKLTPNFWIIVKVQKKQNQNLFKDLLKPFRPLAGNDWGWLISKWVYTLYVNLLIPSHSILHKATLHWPSLAAHDSLHESTLFTGFHVSSETPRSSSFVQRKLFLIQLAGDVKPWPMQVSQWQKHWTRPIWQIPPLKRETPLPLVMSFFHVASCLL